MVSLMMKFWNSELCGLAKTCLDYFAKQSNDYYIGQIIWSAFGFSVPLNILNFPF